ncbi:hypothetical protein VTG60DRAFT_4550 [Thermothelomyces hinnuleus]
MCPAAITGEERGAVRSQHVLQWQRKASHARRGCWSLSEKQCSRAGCGKRCSAAIGPWWFMVSPFRASAPWPGHLKRGAVRLQGGGSSSSTRRIPGYNRGGPTREGVAGTRAAICLAMASLRRLCRAGFCCRLAGSQSLSGVPLFGSGLPLGDRSGKAGDAQHWQNKSQASNGFGETEPKIGNHVQFDPLRPRLVG